MARGPVFKEIRPGAGSKTSDFVKEELRGYRRTTDYYYNYIINIFSPGLFTGHEPASRNSMGRAGSGQEFFNFRG